MPLAICPMAATGAHHGDSTVLVCDDAIFMRTLLGDILVDITAIVTGPLGTVPPVPD